MLPVAVEVLPQSGLMDPLPTYFSELAPNRTLSFFPRTSSTGKLAVATARNQTKMAKYFREYASNVIPNSREEFKKKLEYFSSIASSEALEDSKSNF
jgi:hypothetical protein